MPSTVARQAVGAVFSATSTRPASTRLSQAAMGGHANITLVGASAGLLEACAEWLSRFEALWSRFIPTSDITRLNLSEGRPTPVDPLTVQLIRAMQAGHAATSGDFDPTLLPSLVASGYGRSRIDPAKVTSLPPSAVSPGSLAGIRITEPGPTDPVGTLAMVTVPLGTTLDAGGIGKGLAADLICQFALAQGAWGVMAEIGGDLVVAGDAPDQVAWRIGVENPFDATAQVAVIRLVAGATATSSVRKRRWTTPAGERHHLFDPATGDSTPTEVQTVTVIARSGAQAEALTKSGFIREPAAYLAWLPTQGAAGLIVTATGGIRTSENWDLYL
jgi:thiamine biosynthesis lipoprotein